MAREATVIEADQFDQWFDDYMQEIASADFSPVMDRCADILRRGFAEAFAQERGPDGPWQPRRIDVGVITGRFPADFARPLLVLSGDLFNAVTGLGPGGIARKSASELIVGVSGSTIPYAASHQFGDRVYLPAVGREIDIPARQYVYATKETLDKLEEEIAKHMMERVL